MIRRVSLRDKQNKMHIYILVWLLNTAVNYIKHSEVHLFINYTKLTNYFRFFFKFID